MKEPFQNSAMDAILPPFPQSHFVTRLLYEKIIKSVVECFYRKVENSLLAKTAKTNRLTAVISWVTNYGKWDNHRNR